ncbi:MAG TPA: hypothetical protein VM098_08110 [Phycisphaerae bacterium]|nr:hypothetical protein [Phycisphaerae bacterium]
MSQNRYRFRFGGAWATGLGLLGLVVTVGIILWLVSIWADSVSSSTGGRGPGPLLDRVEGQIDGFNQRNKNLVPQAEANAAAPPRAHTWPPDANAAPAPVDANTASAAGDANAPAGPARPSGGPEAGTPIGPISPVTPVAPMINDQPGVNTKNLKTPATQLDDAMKKRNEELEKAMKGE